MNLKFMTPEKIYIEHESLRVRYRKFPGSVFKRPFLVDATQEYVSNSPTQQYTDVNLATDKSAVQSVCALEPKGFIFHVSRCGSTLLSQMLSTFPENLVVAEPEPVSYYLYYCLKDRIRFDADTFKLLLGSYGQRYNGPETEYFVKFTSWNITFIEEILKAYPHVPWIFMVRDPLEIMVSNSKKPVAPIRWFKNDPFLASRVANLSLEALGELSEDGYLAKLLDQYETRFRSALKLNSNALKIQYVDLPSPAIECVMEHFGLNPDHDDLAAVHQRALLNAKYPEQGYFLSDSAKKQAEVTHAMRLAVASR